MCEVRSAKWAAARKEGGEQREKREEGTDKGYKRAGKGSVPEGRDGREKGRPLGERREERRASNETERKAQSGVWIRGHFGSSSQALLAFLQFFILHPSCDPATAVAIRAAHVAVLGR